MAHPALHPSFSGNPLNDVEIETVERDYPDGLTSHQIVELFADRGMRFSEATLRKYVQLGLLPRSRRIGLKGKHRGSLGLYPVNTIRRINTIKRLMTESHTIEEVRDVLAESVELDPLREELRSVVARLEQRLKRVATTTERRKGLQAQIESARQSAEEWLRRIASLDKECRPGTKRPVVVVPPAPPRTLGLNRTEP